MVKDIHVAPRSGYPIVTACLLLIGLCIYAVVWSARTNQVLPAIAALVIMLVCLTVLAGLFMVNPNEARVLQLFGRYTGTVREPGLLWANPFFSKAKVSLRVRNFETNKVKVNDSNGNPVEIAAVVVWQVVDSAEALFEVNDFVNYVHVQSESAMRNLATTYPYDSHGEDVISLAGDTASVSQRLQQEIHERLDKAGVRVIEARISHLAYAQEIAAAMLQRQQAAAVVAARQQIVEGAVGMVDMALAKLNERGIVRLDEERKAAMVSNLLVVLCSDRHTQPVVNTGTLYN
ncbi:MAG: SPFH domain-containing protein [bacterium]|jgi:regulator of protease activity HflC (stomatin/prohibitin superfamily)|nr:SPFH domain-containing protein [bacterium]